MSTRARFFRVAILAALLPMAMPARAADAEVEARFKKGVELYKEADFRTALVEFNRAYEKSKNYKILYNVAQCEYQLTNYVAALASFERYLKEGGSAIDRARREEVEQELPKIKARIATVTVSTNVNGAAVTVDDQLRGTTPLDKPLLLNAGTHRIVAKKEGHVDATQSVEVAGGDVSSIELRLKPVAEATPPAPTPVTAPPGADADSGGSWAPAIVAFSATGVLAGAAIGFGLSANAKSDDLEAAKKLPNPSPDQLADLDSSVGTRAVVTDVLVGAAVVSGLLGVYFTVTRRPGSSSSQSTGAVRFAPRFGGVGGTF